MAFAQDSPNLCVCMRTRASGVGGGKLEDLERGSLASTTLINVTQIELFFF